MGKLNIMVVFGTRPEAIKMAPLILELKKHQETINTITVVTAQHRQMLDQVLDTFEIVPDYDLDIMGKNQSLQEITSKILSKFDPVVKKEKPDLVLVHGDTTTTFAAGLVAFYNKVSIGHVEAGLRTYDKYSPYPEEMNRQITGRIATYNFSPTPLSEKNLLDEKAHGNIYVTGNTVVDALHMVVDKLKTDETLAKEQDNVLAQAGYDVARLSNGKKLVLITGHRRENIGDGYIRMVNDKKDLSE